MTVFVAGGSGAIGAPLVRALIAAGHDVTALTRTAGGHDALRALGATPVAADALNRDALIAAVAASRPTHVIHQLTALPKEGPRRPADLEATNRLRVEGTRNLIAAAAQAGARRLLVGSFALLSGRGSSDAAGLDAAATAVRSMESQTLQASRAGLLAGVVLRYGMFYGLGSASTMKMVELVRKRRLPVVRGDSGLLPFIHLDDAVAATMCALDRAPAGGAYDIVDDRAVSMAEIVEGLAHCTGSMAPLRMPGWLPRLVAPYMARMMSTRLPLSNALAKAELGWQPKYPTIADGLDAMFPQRREVGA